MVNTRQLLIILVIAISISVTAWVICLWWMFKILNCMKYIKKIYEELYKLKDIKD